MEVDNSSSSTCSASSSRQRFNIELRPGETTIVSWKKLIKEANKSTSSPAPAPAPAVVTASAHEAHKVQVALDEYFQDENPTTKYNNFIVNKEKSEHLNEPISSADCQLRKRKKYLPKAFAEKVDDHVMNKHAKLGHARPKVAAKNIPSTGQSSNHSQSSAIKSETYHDRKSQHSLMSSIGCSRKKIADTSPKSESSFYSGISNRDASVLLSNSKDTEKQRIGTSQCRSSGNNLKDASEFSGVTHLKYEDRNASKQFDPQGKTTLTDSIELKLSTNVWQREKNGSNGLPDLNIPASPIEPMKTTSYSKDSLRPKGTTLERAIRDLEKVVAESRPANIEVQNAVTSSIAIKRRLPREVKQKLAKVARLAQSSQGKISEELVNRLMSILGHLVQLRTLKRNLREMVLLGLSAKREKADRFQQIKMEVTEMIKLQEAFGLEKKGVPEEKFEMDNVLEDKICDLYDLYIQGMDEDKGPQIRKLYAELAELWPNGAMDNHGIKKAICRAKERRRASYDDEKVRSRKSSMPRTGDIVQGEVTSMAQPQAVHERLITESNTHNLASPNKMISNAAAFNHQAAAPERMSSPMLKAFNMDLPKHEKPSKMTLLTSKEQLKQQQQEIDNRVNKLSLKSNKESHKSHKRTGSNPHLAPPPPSM
ncbi:hypothetical protein ACOSQ4_023976 [Xanthoceras sorbifolium]